MEGQVKELWRELISARNDEPLLLVSAIVLVVVWLATLGLMTAKLWAWIVGL